MNLSQANKPHMKDMLIFSPVLLSKYDIPPIRPPVEQTKKRFKYILISKI